MPVANNQADPWDVDYAAAVPLLADDADPFAFGAAVAPTGKTNTIVTAVEVPADTPATTPDDAGGDWATADDFAPAPAPSTTPAVTDDDWLTGAPSASADADADPFGPGGGNADPFSGPAQNDPFSIAPPSKNKLLTPISCNVSMANTNHNSNSKEEKSGQARSHSRKVEELRRLLHRRAFRVLRSPRA